MFLKHLNNDIDYQTNTGEERFYIPKLQKATADLFRAFLKKSWPFTDIKQKKKEVMDSQNRLRPERTGLQK